MTNEQIRRHVEAFVSTRQEWIDILVNNPESTHAAQHIVSINSKIELLRALWNWSDESVEFP